MLSKSIRLWGKNPTSLPNQQTKIVSNSFTSQPLLNQSHVTLWRIKTSKEHQSTTNEHQRAKPRILIITQKPRKQANYGVLPSWCVLWASDMSGTLSRGCLQPRWMVDGVSDSATPASWLFLVTVDPTIPPSSQVPGQCWEKLATCLKHYWWGAWSQNP